MGHATRKTICWILLFAGAGVILLMIILILDEGVRVLDREGHYILGAAVMATVLAGGVLRNSYRAEPANFSGFWHLSLTDLLGSVFFGGMIMAAFRALWPNNFMPIGMFVSLVLTCGFAFCILLAARKGYTRSLLKFLCAGGYFLIACGGLAVGAFCGLSICLIFMNGSREIGRWVLQLFYLREGDGSPSLGLFLNIVRAGMLSLPAGCFLIRRSAQIAERSARREAESDSLQPLLKAKESTRD